MISCLGSYLNETPIILGWGLASAPVLAYSISVCIPIEMVHFGPSCVTVVSCAWSKWTFKICFSFVKFTKITMEDKY